MPLEKGWEPLERSTIGAVPDRYGVYELGGTDGTVLSVEHGPLRSELKEALAYGDAARVRWRPTQNRAEAERLVAEHRERMESR
ncbi:uncharacterized protein Nmlp_2328 [Natronomonas moolapensis 8.8.11]|uniref:DUF7508 domain-containing protein n=1 Tax=Natronomonas moolapensis (strain DSM 18674 / CECT 7526 / JCM 14361 / 8.8.11) TaxID=268739 RepID=M1XKT9_NATM8|nr:hypothetical protein [Natronomonas moolapensis]CCQ36496.1 uncharacterized protein Nmlp_2328 [Natronomonas moolapensis 8.8.11]